MSVKCTLNRLGKRRICGVDLVTITASEYADLLQSRLALRQMTIDARCLTKTRLSAIERRPEVANFLVMGFGRVPMKTLLAQCRKRFGAKATPSKSAAYRYWQNVRRKGTFSGAK